MNPKKLHINYLDNTEQTIECHSWVCLVERDIVVKVAREDGSFDTLYVDWSKVHSFSQIG